MQYPLISEYVRAIQDAASNLDKLAHLEPVADSHGEPYRSSGAFAVVFKMRDPQTGRCYALKCFTEEQKGRAEAYRRIADELETVDSTYLTTVKYYEGELFVDSPCDDDCFPVLLMDWIEGETMEAYIAAHWRDTCAMSMLCYRFCRMAAWLRSQPFAHGDIKPDNVMVREDGTLALVDYDGMFVPSMKGQKSPTIGTKDFSHPLRTVDDFDETIDDFSLASIALSLKAMSLDATLREKYSAADRLLFSVDDYRDPGKSAVLTAMQPLLTDADLRTLLSQFLLASAKKDLSQASFRLFTLPKPPEPEILSTEVTEADLAAAIEEFGYSAKYSFDRTRLLRIIGFTDVLYGYYSIRSGTKVICDNAFRGCNTLTDLIIPDSVICVGDSAFSGCELLTDITIPTSIKKMHGNPFCDWNGKLINESPYFTYEDDVLFSKNKDTLIAFRQQTRCCYYVISYVIPSSVTGIGSNAFYKCSSLSNLTIPSSVTVMYGNPFNGWNGKLINKSTHFVYEDEVLFSEDRSLIIAFRHRSAISYAVPDSVRAIGDRAFSYCDSLVNVQLHSGVAKIGDYAFYSCKTLSSVIIPDGVTRIGKGAFQLCNSLKSIAIADSVESVGFGAFSGCGSLSQETRDEITKRFGEDAFKWLLY